MKKYIFIIILLFQGCNLGDTSCIASDGNTPILKYLVLDNNYYVGKNGNHTITSIGYKCDIQNGALYCKEVDDSPYYGWGNELPAIRMVYNNGTLIETFGTEAKDYYKNYSIYLESSNGSISSFDINNIDTFELAVLQEPVYRDICGGFYQTYFTTSLDNHTTNYYNEYNLTFDINNNTVTYGYIIDIFRR